MATLESNPFYVPRDGQPPNPFAAFWGGFLQTRLPWAQQVFTARLAAMNPAQQRQALVALAQERTKLIQNMDENLRAAERNALERDLQDDRLMQTWLEGDFGLQRARVSAQGDITAARIGLAGKMMEAGTLSPKAKDILGRYKEQVNAAQLDLANAPGPDADGRPSPEAQAALRAIAEATANTKTEAQALGTMERMSFNNAVDGELGDMLVTDPMQQAAVRRIISPAFPRSENVPEPEVGGVGGSLPNIQTAADAVARLRGSSAPSTGDQTLAPPRAVPASAPSPRSSSAPGSGGTQSPARDAAPGGSTTEGGGVRRTSSSTSASRSMPASGGMFGTMDQLQRLDELEGRLQAEDPTRALGDFDDPLPGGQPRRARPARPTRGAGPSEAAGILGALKGSPEGKQGKEKGQKEKGKRGKEEPQRDPELAARAFNNLQAGRPMPPPELGPGRATRAENASSVRERSYGPPAPEKPAPKKRSKPAPKKEAPNLGESEQEFDSGPGESPQETEAERILRQLQPPQSEQEPDEDRLGESELEDDRLGESEQPEEKEEPDLGESEIEDRLGESELEDEPDLGESEQPKKKPRRLVPGGPIPGKR